MKINDKILSLPPYVSTQWTNVSSLRMEASELVVHMFDGTEARVPSLDGKILEKVFECHAASLEGEMEEVPVLRENEGGIGLEMNAPQFQLGMEGLGGMGAAMAHNPDQSDAPDLPSEILEKVARVAQIVAPDEAKDLPKPEPHCNCVYCQIARAIQTAMDGGTIEAEPESKSASEEPLDETVSEEELSFCQWNIESTGEQMFAVTNRLDEAESYHVYLGHPVGCTCGEAKCEHIVAVLRS